MSNLKTALSTIAFFGAILGGLYLFSGYRIKEQMREDARKDAYAKEMVFRSLPQVHYVDSTYHARIDSMNRVHDAQIDSLRIKYHKRLENIMGE